MDISKGHLLLISSIGKSTDHVSSISPGYRIFINNDHLYFGTTLSFSIMIWRSVSKILQFSCFDRQVGQKGDTIVTGVLLAMIPFDISDLEGAL